jgi:ketosteroid isomerase-like protein
MTDSPNAIVALEKRFWQSMVDKDPEAAMTLIADECLIAGPMGTNRIDPQDYKRMTEQGDWDLEKFEFSNVDVIFPAEDTAIVAYKVHQTGTLHGKAMDMTCADSTAWVRDGEEWKCALHTETILETA